MKRKKTIIFGGIVLIIAACAIGLFTQFPKWSQRSFDAVAKETVTQPDGEIRLIVERTTEIYGDPINSLGIGRIQSYLIQTEKASPQKIFLLQFCQSYSGRCF